VLLSSGNRVEGDEPLHRSADRRRVSEKVLRGATALVLN